MLHFDDYSLKKYLKTYVYIRFVVAVTLHVYFSASLIFDRRRWGFYGAGLCDSEANGRLSPRSAFRSPYLWR